MAKQLIANNLQFRRIVKKVEKFWKAISGSVCMRCCKISHECLGSCENKSEKYIMCIRKHQVSEHQYKVGGYNKEIRKLCVYVVARCTNY